MCTHTAEVIGLHGAYHNFFGTFYRRQQLGRCGRAGTFAVIPSAVTHTSNKFVVSFGHVMQSSHVPHHSFDVTSVSLYIHLCML